MDSDLLVKTFKFKILSFFYCWNRELLNPLPVDFSSLFVFSSRSSLSSLSMSFPESFGYVCLFDSFIFLFLVSEASILFDFRFLLFSNRNPLMRSQSVKKPRGVIFRPRFLIFLAGSIKNSKLHLILLLTR